MQKKFLFALVLTQFFLVAAATALETDNYIVWKRELKDSSLRINGHLASEIEAALKISNTQETPQDCVAVTKEIAIRFKSHYIHENPLENWLKTNLADDEIYPRTGEYVKDSIYRDPFRFYIPAFGLSPNVSVNGINFGTDKLTHFSSTGRRYFNHYLKSLKKGRTEEEARRKAVLYGIKNERSILGFWASGVYSYGDIEANYQGLLFYKKMCLDSSDPYLELKNTGKWALVRLPDIREYASPYWDETYNLSYRLKKNWKKVSRVIKDHYCPLSSDPQVVSRMDYYRRFPHKSFSLDIINELQRKGFKGTPVPEYTQSVADLCH